VQRRYRNFVTRRRTQANPRGEPVYPVVTACDRDGACELLGLSPSVSTKKLRAYLRDARTAEILLVDADARHNRYTRRVREADGKLHRRFVFTADPLTAKRDLRNLWREPPEGTRVPRPSRVSVIEW
jgi:hypothetical protein